MAAAGQVSAAPRLSAFDWDPRFVWLEEFAEEPVPELWPDDAVGIDLSHLGEAPGPGLAATLAGGETIAHGDTLLAMIGAWRRLASWAKAGEFAAVAAFLDHRTRGVPGNQAFEAAVSEIQLELTLTGYGTDHLLELACPLSERLPQTMTALGDGAIDESKARVIARGVLGVQAIALCRQVETRVLPTAPSQTTGQLRNAVERAVIAAAPEAAERRRKDAEAGRGVEIRPTDAHTADLCGRDLPTDRALAADARLTALATALKSDGDPHSLTFLRAQVFLSLLLGSGRLPAWPPSAGLPGHASGDQQDDSKDAHDSGSFDDTAAYRPGEGSDGGGEPAGSAAPSHRTGMPPKHPTGGGVHVIVPIDTLRGLSDRPGEIPGHGAVPASVARAIAATTAGRRWCFSVVDPAGQTAGHGHIPARDTGITNDFSPTSPSR